MARADFIRSLHSGLRLLLWSALLCLLSGCTGVFLQPDHRHYFPDRSLGTPSEAVWLAGEDGLRLHALYLPATGTPRGRPPKPPEQPKPKQNKCFVWGAAGVKVKVVVLHM